jgi:hypothetical protein
MKTVDMFCDGTAYKGGDQHTFLNDVLFFTFIVILRRTSCCSLSSRGLQGTKTGAHTYSGSILAASCALARRAHPHHKETLQLENEASLG